MRVIATAGHVDHGKSTLVHAITGTDPDRLAEEKTRGLTIDLGFATTTLPTGEEIEFVDVPGHARFIKNMLAGVTPLDACLFVVAATEGWKAQSEEHLRILEILGMRRGAVALTKVAGLDEAALALIVSQVRDRLEGTFLADAEIVPVDVLHGVGRDEVEAALGRLTRGIPPAEDRSRARLWVDRSFPIRGAGTVVTGTLTGGRLAVDDSLVVLPGGSEVRVRGLQSHHRDLARAEPGRRLAVNLVRVSHREIRRGDALVRDGEWQLAGVLDASLQVLGTLDHPVDQRGAYTLAVGTADPAARIRILGRRSRLEPGESGAIRIWLSGSAGLPLHPGDRYVLRETGRRETVGGGEVLDVEPILPPAQARPTRDVERVIEERGWVDVDHLWRLTGERRLPSAGRWVVSERARTRMITDIRKRCADAGDAGTPVSEQPGVVQALLTVGVDGVRVWDGRAYDESVSPGDVSERAKAVLADLEASPWSPPDLPLQTRGDLRLLQRRGLAVEAGELWFASSAIEAAIGVLSELLDRRPDGFTVSEAREVLGTSRKYALPLLGYLDAHGVTRRAGDVRVAGPRRPARNVTEEVAT